MDEQSDRRLLAVLRAGDVEALRELLAAEPGRASAGLRPSPGHPRGASPLGFVAMLRFDPATGVWGDVPGAGDLARALVEAGAPVDGEVGDAETPLITAASYGDAAVAAELLSAGADLDARSSAQGGGVPEATALLHAAVFGMTSVVDVLVAAGATPGSVEEAAAVGDVSGFIEGADEQARLRALVMAADHQRLDVVDDLVAAGTPVDRADAVWGRHPLRLAAAGGRDRSVAHLLALGADPQGVDDDGASALELCRAARASHRDQLGFDRVEALLSAS
ncbi:ankyrin repeat domain-containing protein [Pedococcus bigeumensis]|uniref:ankyrin repeat domain-containing protein n=1 Tax=Pedococcus bigeumensis TaxID=433644 RepID=UPI0031D2AA1C